MASEPKFYLTIAIRFAAVIQKYAYAKALSCKINSLLFECCPSIAFSNIIKSSNEA